MGQHEAAPYATYGHDDGRVMLHGAKITTDVNPETTSKSDVHHDMAPLTGDPRQVTPPLSDFFPARAPISVARSDIPPGTKKFYGVRVGKRQGIYFSYYGSNGAEAQVKGVANARYRSSKSLEEMIEYVNHSPTECNDPSGHCCEAARREAETERKKFRLNRPPTGSLPPPEKSSFPSNRLIGWENVDQAGSVPREVCTCGTDDPIAKVVVCAGPSCPTKLYHDNYVGLSNREPPPSWRCRGCRPHLQPLGESPLGTGPLDKIPFRESEEVRASPELPATSLSLEQAHVVSCVLKGDNVCYLGSAGTGKSFVLKAIKAALKERMKWVDTIAASGIAALNVEGQTFYSYASWYPESFKKGIDSLRDTASHAKNVRKRLIKTDVLIVEEVSMLESSMFDALDQICRAARSTFDPDRDGDDTKSPHDVNSPFGGLQIIVTGDYHQLPPVRPFRFCIHCGGDELDHWDARDGRDLQCAKCRRVFKDHDKWAFRSEAWEKCHFRYIQLEKIHRQSDEVFISLLQHCREGKPFTDADRKLLMASRDMGPGHVPQLVPTRDQAARINKAHFDRLPSPDISFECLDYQSWRKEEHPQFVNRFKCKYDDRPNGPLKSLDDHRLQELAHFKVGTVVLLAVNLDLKGGLVNGAEGNVVGFRPYDYMDTHVETQSKEYADIKAAQIKAFIEQAPAKYWPVVEFRNGVTRTIGAHCTLTELGPSSPYSLIGRTQIPLMHAWAITIHKSQGMTLHRVCVDLARSFEREMVYVALSRAKSLDGLLVKSLPADFGDGVDKQVARFYREKFGVFYE